MKIFLIGMPGSGKSTIGSKLSMRLAVDFVDLDNEIEMREGSSVQDIFAKGGEDYFRQIESQLLREWVSSPTSFVMATGGGTPCFHDGINIIKQSGVSIFLDESIDVLSARLDNKSNRPLLHSNSAVTMRDKLIALKEVRKHCYQQATFTVLSPTLAKILELLKIKS